MSSVLSTNSDQEVPPTIGGFAAITLYPDVLPTLSLLRDTSRLGLVTNGNTYPERCGLPGLFAFTIFAQDCQVQKPQPEFYERVLVSDAHTPSGDHSCWRFLTQRRRWSASSR